MSLRIPASLCLAATLVCACRNPLRDTDSPSTLQAADTPDDSAAKFAEGSCITVKGGELWKIQRIDDGRYFVRVWQAGRWGREVNFGIGHFEGRGFQSAPCPDAGPI